MEVVVDGMAADERLVLLANALDCRAGLSFEEVRDAGFLGDAPKEESLKKTFARYRDEFDALGLIIEELDVDGVRRYRLNTRLTYAKPQDITLAEEERIDLLATLAAYLEGSDRPFDAAVRSAYKKLASAMGRPWDAPTHTREASYLGTKDVDPVHKGLYSAYTSRVPVRFSYCNQKGERGVHVVEIYAFFRHLDQTYFVGPDREREGNPIRLFRVSRVESAASIHPLKNERYEVPSDFDVAEWKRLPFEYAGTDDVTVTFTCTSEPDDAHIRELVRNRGTWEKNERGWVWTVHVCDLATFAGWAAAAASAGLVVTAPNTAVEAVRRSLLETEAVYG